VRGGRRRDCVLIIEDERSYRVLLEMNLRRTGYHVVQAGTGAEGLAAAASEGPDLVLLDMRLPDMDGDEVCAALRRQGSVPIIMLTARAEQAQKVRGLQLGADDYVTKPFDVDELLARIAAVLRRARANRAAAAPPSAAGVGVYRHGALEIDPAAPRVTIEGAEVPCSATEYRLLEILARNAGRVLVQEELLRQVWGPGYEQDAALLHTAIWRLRRKLEQDARQPEHLLSLRGVGYSLAAPDGPPHMPHVPHNGAAAPTAEDAAHGARGVQAAQDARDDSHP
jgi:DNA-binding response OmpR family regulator